MLSEIRVVSTHYLPQNVLPEIQPESLLFLERFWDNSQQRVINLTYRGKKLELRGIPEDFKVYLDNKLVGEVAYDNVYNYNIELIRELVL